MNYMIYKATLRIPTDQYAYIEVNVEGNTPEEIVEHYNLFKKEWDGGEGLPEKEWNSTLCKYLETISMESHAYERMNKYQQSVIQQLKRAFKRMEEVDIKIKSNE